MKEEKKVGTLERPVTMIQLEVRCVCRCGYVLYVMTRRLLKLHQYWVRLKLGAEKGAHHLEQARFECALIKAHTYICRHPLHCSAFVHPHLHFNMTQQMVSHSDHLLSTSNLHFAHSIPPPSPFPLPLLLAWAGRCNTATCSQAIATCYSVRPHSDHFYSSSRGGGGGSGEGSRGVKV